MQWIRHFRNCVISAAMASCLSASGDELTARGLAVESRNDSPSFMVRVSVDHEDHSYRIGDEMKMRVRSEKSGYLYLFYIDSQDKVAVVFPNNIQQDNFIQKSQDVDIPSADSEFRFRVTDPPGEEVLRAIVSSKPLDHLDSIGLTRASFSRMSQTAFRQSENTLREKLTSSSWAEHSVTIQVHEVPETARTDRRRHLISVGVGKYRDTSIPPLRTPGIDATRFAEMMQQRGKLNSSRVLIDDAATLNAVEQAITVEACEATTPGDTVFIYWSGHGTTISDTNGDEADGYDECLMLNDTSRVSVESVQQTMLTDDCFGRWIQRLDGRTVVLIIDACHSGGQSITGKGIGEEDDSVFGFFDNELVRAKDIGQTNMAMITSSNSDQLSFERPDGSSSVMTGFLLQKMSGDSMLDLDIAFQHVATAVPEFVKHHIPGAGPQEPAYFRQLTERVLLIP